MLLFSHENLEPDPVLGVDCCQWGAKACDASLGLLDVVLEKVSIDHHVDHFFMFLTVGNEHAEAIAQSVVDGANAPRQHI